MISKNIFSDYLPNGSTWRDAKLRQKVTNETGLSKTEVAVLVLAGICVVSFVVSLTFGVLLRRHKGVITREEAEEFLKGTNSALHDAEVRARLTAENVYLKMEFPEKYKLARSHFKLGITRISVSHFDNCMFYVLKSYLIYFFPWT